MPTSVVGRPSTEGSALGANEIALALAVTDGSILPGKQGWFYDLKRQPDGRWRIVGGGTGPWLPRDIQLEQAAIRGPARKLVTAG